MSYWHLNFATFDRMPLFSGGAETRDRALCQLGGLRALALVLFCIVDDHFHAVVKGSRAHAGKVVWRLKRTWEPLLQGPLQKGFYRRVEGRQHMRSLVRYVLQQPRIHGLEDHPALYSGSCFADLVGARHLPGLDLGLHEALPRLDLGEIFRAVELPPALEPVGDQSLAKAGSEGLVKAASFAVGGAHVLAKQGARGVAGRTAIAHLGRMAGIGRAELAEATHCSRRSLRRFAKGAPTPEILRAIHLRLAVEKSLEQVVEQSDTLRPRRLARKSNSVIQVPSFQQ